MVLAAGHPHPGPLLVRDFEIAVALVVLQQDVILRAVLLDEAALQDQSLKLTGAEDVIEIPDIFHHFADFVRVTCLGAEILADPVFEDLGFADVDDLSSAVFHDVDAGVQRQTHGPLAQFTPFRVFHGLPPLCTDFFRIVPRFGQKKKYTAGGTPAV